MFKLVTGLPGEGKTSNELWDFLNNPAYSGRPKYCTPVNGFDPAAHNVTPIEHVNIWQDLPEGAVIFCDEVQDFIGTDLPSQPPEWVKQLARHRHKGVDFIATTQSPMFLHPFVRKLAKPHIHYHRPWNMKMVRYEYESVQGDPLSSSSKKLGQRRFVTPNPEVFKLYTSTVLDTHKAKPPKKLIILICIALAMLLGGGLFALSKITSFGKPKEQPVAQAPLQPQTQAVTTKSSFEPPAVRLESQSTTWTADNMTPRVAGLPHTAPIYDTLTAPTDFPRVAACMSSEARAMCKCYTQQGTPLDVPASACYVYVKFGSFDPWLTSRRQQQQPEQVSKVENSPAESVKAESVDASKAPQRNLGAAFTVIADSSRGGDNVLK